MESQQSAPHDPAARLPLLMALRLSTNGAFRFLYPFLPVVARDLGVPTERAGLIVSSIAVGGMLAPLTRRLLTGGHERDRVLLVRASLLLTVGILVAAGAPTLLIAIVGFALLGAMKPLSDIATVSYVSARVEYRRRARATSAMELTWAGGLLVMAPAAGLVAAAWGWRVALAALAGLVLLATLAAGTRLERDPSGHDLARPPRTPLGPTGWRFLGAVWLVFIALESTFAVYGIWLDDTFGVSIEQLGLFAALSALGELAGSGSVMLFGDRLGKVRAARIGLLTTTVGALLVGLAGSLPLAVAAMAVALLGSEAGIVAVIPLATEVLPGARTRFLAAVVSSASASRALAAGLAPAIYVSAGIRGNAVVTAASAVAAIGLLSLTVRRDPRLADELERPR